MANQGPSYGLSRQVKRKLELKYNEDMELEARQWMSRVLGTNLSPSAECPIGARGFQSLLKDSSVLCDVMNALSPASIANVKSKMKTDFFFRERLECFLKAAKLYGVPEISLFQVEDLYDGKNMTQAITKGYNGPKLGTKMSEKNQRDFDEQTNIDSRKVLPMQAGYNKGASQAGMKAPGTQRQIQEFEEDHLYKLP